MGGNNKILVFADWYEPGFKAGGPIRSCVNFVRYMRDSHSLYVFTTDRDLGSTEPYDVVTDEWISPGHPDVRIYYCSPGNLSWRSILRRMREVNPDFIYLNSMFSTPFTIMPLLITRLYGIRGNIVLSPRGMLRSSALQFKPKKKQVFLKLFRLLGLHRRITFHASDVTEMQDVQKHFGASASVTMIGNFPAALPEVLTSIEKRQGELSLVFIGRVHPIKNLDYILKVLKELRARIHFTIVGSLEDKAYWDMCSRLIKELPENVSVEYAGEVPHHGLQEISVRHHLFVLPTRGENFGHAIFESLALGRPVLISDQTPWRGLEGVHAGWDLSLERPELFRQAMEDAAGFDQEEYNRWSQSTFRYVQDFVAGSTLRKDYLHLFNQRTEG